MRKATYLITFSRGLEEVVAREVEKITGRSPELGHNHLLLNAFLKDAYNLILWGRCIHKVYLILSKGEFSTLEDIGKKVSEVSYDQILPRDVKFRLTTVREGEHDFTSMDANKIVGGYINRKLAEEGLNPKVDLENYDVEFLLKIRSSNYMLAINLVGSSLHKRGYRKFKHPASIRTTLASAMLMLSEWKDEKILDPLAGSGTIPIEAAMKRYNIPPGILRREYPLFNLNIFDERAVKMLTSRVRAVKEENEYERRIFYNDINRKYMEGAIMNASEAGVDKYINFYNKDARSLKVNDEFIVVTNPPYGIRMGRARTIKNFYDGLVSSLSAARRVVSITTRQEEMADAYEKNGIEVKKRLKVKHGNLDAFIIVGE